MKLCCLILDVENWSICLIWTSWIISLENKPIQIQIYFILLWDKALLANKPSVSKNTDIRNCDVKWINQAILTGNEKQLPNQQQAKITVHINNNKNLFRLESIFSLFNINQITVTTLRLKSEWFQTEILSLLKQTCLPIQKDKLRPLNLKQYQLFLSQVMELKENLNLMSCNVCCGCFENFKRRILAAQN